MRKIKYISQLGEEFVFSNSPPFILQKIEISQGVNNISVKSAAQDGKTYIGSNLDEKEISLTVAILGSSRYQYSKYKDKLYQVFNPRLGEGTLIYSDGIKEEKIRCIPEKIPFLTELNNKTGTCLISLCANDPFWTDLGEAREEIALWKGDFEFDFELSGDGIELGHREPSLIVNCINGGDVESGMKIEFKALATLSNPSLFNVNTREFIKINKTMTAGEVITVTTYFGEKRITSLLNGIEENNFNYIDPESTFLQLAKGDNLMRYDADTGLDNLEVAIYHRNRYLEV